VAFTGCKGKGGVYVSGQATIDGKPLDYATLEFLPAERGSKIGGDTVQTDAQGNFTIEPDKRKKGLEPGTYAVRVSKWVDKKTGKPPDPPEMFEQLKAANMLKNVVPYRYMDPNADAPIKVEIKAGKNEGVKIEVQGK